MLNFLSAGRGASKREDAAATAEDRDDARDRQSSQYASRDASRDTSLRASIGDSLRRGSARLRKESFKKWVREHSRHSADSSGAPSSDAGSVRSKGESIPQVQLSAGDCVPASHKRFVSSQKDSAVYVPPGIVAEKVNLFEHQLKTKASAVAPVVKSKRKKSKSGASGSQASASVASSDADEAAKVKAAADFESLQNVPEGIVNERIAYFEELPVVEVVTPENTITADENAPVEESVTTLAGEMESKSVQEEKKIPTPSEEKAVHSQQCSTPSTAVLTDSKIFKPMRRNSEEITEIIAV